MAKDKGGGAEHCVGCEDGGGGEACIGRRTEAEHFAE